MKKYPDLTLEKLRPYLYEFEELGLLKIYNKRQKNEQVVLTKLFKELKTKEQLKEYLLNPTRRRVRL